LEPESAEFLALCVKKIKGLEKKRGNLKLVEAKFVWTEPHSRRIKVAVTVENEVFNNVIVRQGKCVEFKQTVQMCGLCQRSAMDMNWSWCVQVRQNCADFKRTFRKLEQDLIRSGMDRFIVSVEEKANGFDLYFAGKSECKTVLDFLKAHLPLNCTAQPTKHGSTYTHSTYIAPLNKLDLVLVPEHQKSHRVKLMLLKRVASSIKFIDPQTGDESDITSQTYWKAQTTTASSSMSSSSKSKKNRSAASSTGGSASVTSVAAFTPFISRNRLIEFVVIDVSIPEMLGTTNNKSEKRALYNVTVAKESDFGANDKVLYVRTHLSNLEIGDYVLGYDLSTVNLTESHIEAFGESDLPDAILVHKVQKDKAPKKKKASASLARVQRDEKLEQQISLKEAHVSEFLGDVFDEIDENEDIPMHGIVEQMEIQEDINPDQNEDDPVQSEDIQY
jgi:nonsense-mediated mRNA decay protein 3